MNGMLLIISSLIVGQLLSRTITATNREQLINSLNLVAVRISLPALIFIKIQGQPFSTDALFPIIMPWVLFFATIAIIYLINLFYPLNRATRGLLIILAGTGNTSFVGFPLITALMGDDQYLQYAIFYDQSNFILLFTLGIFLADHYTGKAAKPAESLVRLLRFIPIQALIIALLLRPFSIPMPLLYTLDQFAQLITPLTMISVGASLRLPKSCSLLSPLFIGLFIKLILLPLITFSVLRFLYRAPILEINQVVLLQSAMAPMVLATVIAREKNLEPELANLLTAIGIPLSFISVSLWFSLSQLL